MRTLLALVTLLLLAGCAPKTSAPASYVRYTIGENRYFLEVENTQGSSSLTFNSKSSGTKVDEEHYDLSWGKGQSLKIDNGKLQVNGINYGEISPGAKIVVKGDGKLLINGEERIAPP